MKKHLAKVQLAPYTTRIRQFNTIIRYQNKKRKKILTAHYVPYNGSNSLVYPFYDPLGEMVMARLSGPQIAAAMALAKMTQDQLAEAAGLGRNTLNRTINDTAETKDETLTSIRRALEARGIEFLSDEGVKRHFGTVDRMEGDDALHRFFDDVYDTVKDGGDLCVSGADERSFAKFNINDFGFRQCNLAAIGAIGCQPSFIKTAAFADITMPCDMAAAPFAKKIDHIFRKFL